MLTPRLALAAVLSAALLPAQQTPRPAPTAGPRPVGPSPNGAAGGMGGARRGGGPQQQGQQGQGRQAPKEYRAEELASVEGYVRNGATGEALSKATVTLIGTGRQRQPYAAGTDASGKFAIPGIEPGQYRVSVRRNGFVGSELAGKRALSPGANLTLATSQSIKNFEAKLTPHGVVTGRVYDADGEPLVQASVQLMRYVYTSQGQRQLNTTNVAQTNDLGEYRVYGVAPGKYIVGVVMMGGGGPSARFTQGNAESPVPTFFPGTAEAGQASPIDVISNGTAQGIDVRVLTARTFTVSGQVAGSAIGRRGGSVRLLAERQAGAQGMPQMMRGGLNGMVRPDGKFTVRGVPTGSYLIVLDSFDGDERMRGTGEVTVGERDVDNARVMMHTTFDLPTAVKLDGQGTMDLSNLLVNVLPREQTGLRSGTGSGDRTDAAGNTMLKVFPGHYDVIVGGLPAGYFVKAVRAGEAESLLDGARLQPGMRLEVIVSAKGANISGTVANDKGEAVSAASVILLAPNAPMTQRLRTATVDQQGQFNLAGIAPGDYFLAALEDADAGVYWEPEFLTRNAKLIEKISIREGATENKALKVIAGAGQP